MTPKHAPATPLPWEETYEIPRGSADGSWGVCVADGGDVIAQEITAESDSKYIAHAANAYPRLVAAIQSLAAQLEQYVNDDDAEIPDASDARALLRSLGELE